MSEEQLIEKIRDLIHGFLYEKGCDVIYGETIETPQGTFDVELKIIEYDNN